MKNENAITLIALVVTIVVLLILAGVSISMLTGENGVIIQAQRAKIETEISEIEEQANIIYADLTVGKNTGTIEDITMSDIASQLRKKGYRIEQATKTGNEITGISIDPTTTSIAIGGTKQITVNYEGNANENEYYAIINGNHYKNIFTNNN